MVIHEFTHLFLSLVAGVIFATHFKNNRLIVYSILVGVFVDIDHLFDYFLYKKALVFNFHEFLSGAYFDAVDKVILPLHGFEYTILMFIVGLVFLRRRSKKSVVTISILFTLGLSLFFHLFYDTIYYRPKWPTYFISYRIYHHFNHDYFWLKENLNEK